MRCSCRGRADPALRWMYTVAALLVVAYAVGSVSSPFAGRMTREHGRPTVLAMSIVVSAVGLVLMLWAWVPAVLLGLVLLTGGFFAAQSSRWVAARAGARARAQASGLYLCAYYAGSSVGGWAVGAPFTAHGWTALTGAVLVFLAMALLASWRAARLTSESR